MPNFTSLLKDEIARVARKEIRAETSAMKKAVSQYRTDIAALKRQVRDLEQQSKKLRKVTSKVVAETAVDTTEKKLRFSAKGFAEARRRLDLSAAAVGQLIGATGQSVYKWEQGKARPRVKHLAKIAELRTMGKREAAAQLEALAGKTAA